MAAETVDLGARTDSMTTIGVTGQPWRASVSPWGSVMPWGDDADGAGALDWAIAADDRWHLPANESAVRQTRLGGTPVVETRVRIPDGDAVHRVWSVANQGGLTIVEIENDSPLPVAIAFFGRDVLTARTPSDIPIQGIELPAGAITLPVAHHTTIRVGIPHGPIPAGTDTHNVPLSGAASADAVMRGWSALCNSASRVDLPDVGLGEALTAARCDLLLEGPIDPEVDPLGFVLDVGELVRCGDEAEPWLFEVVVPLESVSRSDDPQLGAAVAAAARIAVAADDRRAVKDISKMYDRIVARGVTPDLGPFSELERGPSVGRFVASIEQRLANGGDLLPNGLPASWLGVNFEFHAVPTSPTSTISLAVRWHGERPAALWEQSGPAQALTVSSIDTEWQSSEAAGEGLWDTPRSARSTLLSVASESAPPAPAPPAPTPAASPPPADSAAAVSTPVFDDRQPGTAPPETTPFDDDQDSPSFS